MIQNAETVSVVVTQSETSNGPITVRNEAIGSGVSAGLGTGFVAGGLWGLACGPFAVLCMPLGAITGAVAGTAAGAAVGVTGALADDKAARLRERLGRLQATHSLVDELQRNVNVRAVNYWQLGSGAAATVVNIELQALELMSTRDEQIRCASRVLVGFGCCARSAANR